MRKILSAVLLFLLLFFAAGCDSAPVEVPPTVSFYCNCVLTQTEFEKDNVFLDVYYGDVTGLSDIEAIRLYVAGTDAPLPIPSDDYPIDEDPNFYLLKEIGSEEYNTSGIYDWVEPDGYHETMHIPEALFDREQGEICFVLRVYNTAYPQYIGMPAYSTVYFQQSNNKIILSETTFEEENSNA